MDEKEFQQIQDFAPEMNIFNNPSPHAETIVPLWKSPLSHLMWNSVSSLHLHLIMINTAIDSI